MRAGDGGAMNNNAPFFGIFAACFVLLYGAIALSACTAKKEKEALDADGCQQVSHEKTGKRVYCGKACFRDEFRTEYRCNSGVKVFIR